MARRTCALAIAVLAIGCGDDRRATPVTSASSGSNAPASTPAPAAATTVSITGAVIDEATGRAVPGVDVVLRDTRGDVREVTARTNAAGELSIRTAPGMYRVFVRAGGAMSVGIADRIRLDDGARAELAGAPDEALMPVLDARRDVTGVELTVTAPAVLTGTVLDVTRREVAGAVVRLVATDRFVRRTVSVRPVLGTDTAISDDHGKFTLRVPPGSYVLDATHGELAGVRDTEVTLHAGQRATTEIGLARGCVVTGRVVTADGAPSNDGAIERLGVFRDGFGPAGRIDAGRFRWTTTSDGWVTLRAWPWRSPPSPARSFACEDGKRFDDVVLRLPAQEPDISGVVVDASDHPVPLAYLDIVPLDPVVGGQQERADAAGVWHVYDMPPARYRITASAPGLGIADTVVVAPRHDLRLALGGTGRIVGTTTALVNGTVNVSFLRCGPADSPIEIAHEPRIVRVESGRFEIDRAPACTLALAIRWRDQLVETTTVVEPDRTSYVEIDVGTPRDKTVTGIVRDDRGATVAAARVTAVIHDRDAQTVRTDDSGRFTLHTQAGAQLVAGKNGKVGRSTVGRANVAAEQVDIVLDEPGL